MKKASDQERLAWLRLIRTENVGPVTFRQLLRRFSTAEAALDALPALARRGGATPRIPTLASIEDEIAATHRLGGRIVLASDENYPALLRHVDAAPPVLTLAGGDRLDWSRTVGIVGARNASSAGRKMTRMLAAELGAAGIVVVSGLARGIDASAHEATLASGTVAVLAGGLDRIYPEENFPLAQAILAEGGALVSEMPLGWEPRAHDFPRRNRIVAGVSLGVVVVEAAKRSGSLITARLANEIGRLVFAVPGSPLDPRAEGGNALIRQGATLITGARDILEDLRMVDPAGSRLLEDDDAAEVFPIAAPPGADATARVVEALSLTPVPVDLLVQQTGIPVASMQTILLELDLAGRLEWSGGQLVALRV